MNLSDEGATLIGQIIDCLNPIYFTISERDTTPSEVDVSKRFGAGKGIITNTDAFDDNAEMAALFEDIKA